MRDKWSVAAVLGLLTLGASLGPALAGDSFFGKVTAVKSADLVRLESGQGGYDIRLVGIDVPREGPIANQAREFVSKLVLGRNARMRFEMRNKSGEMVSRLLTAEPEGAPKDVGVELVRAGLARRQRAAGYAFGYKYGELVKAEEEARKGRRGLWATTQP